MRCACASLESIQIRLWLLLHLLTSPMLCYVCRDFLLRSRSPVKALAIVLIRSEPMRYTLRHTRQGSRSNAPKFRPSARRGFRLIAQRDRLLLIITVVSKGSQRSEADSYFEGDVHWCGMCLGGHHGTCASLGQYARSELHCELRADRQMSCSNVQTAYQFVLICLL